MPSSPTFKAMPGSDYVRPSSQVMSSIASAYDQLPDSWKKTGPISALSSKYLEHIPAFCRAALRRLCVFFTLRSTCHKKYSANVFNAAVVIRKPLQLFYGTAEGDVGALDVRALLPLSCLLSSCTPLVVRRFKRRGVSKHALCASFHAA